eukprot:6180329-Pleurochrysis_carterae.AAC.1
MWDSGRYSQIGDATRCCVELVAAPPARSRSGHQPTQALQRAQHGRGQPVCGSAGDLPIVSNITLRCARPFACCCTQPPYYSIY